MNAVILFTRVPLPGKTKTRLEGFLTKEECANLHRHMLRDYTDQLNALIDVKLFGFITPYEKKDEISGFLPERMELQEQIGADLGDKMNHAIQSVFRKGFRKVVLAGADVPGVKADDFRIAFRQLDDYDVVIGPTYDGGYWLIGTKDSRTDLFSIDSLWGVSSVYERTLEHVKKSEKAVYSLSPRRDLDTKDDVLLWMKSEKEGNTHTYRYLKEIGAENRRQDGS